MVSVHCGSSSSACRVWSVVFFFFTLLCINGPLFFKFTHSTLSVFLKLWPPAVSKETGTLQWQQHIKTIWIYRLLLMCKNWAGRKNKGKDQVSLVPALMSDRLALWGFYGLRKLPQRQSTCMCRGAGRRGGRCKINENTLAFMCLHTRLTCVLADEAKMILLGQRARAKKKKNTLTLGWKTNASQTLRKTVIYPTPP